MYILVERQVIAYAVVHDQKLVEFFVDPNEANRAVEIFDAATRVSAVSSVLCKSFDKQLLFAALSRVARVSTSGMLFRRINDTAFVQRDELTFRPGTAGDAETVFGFNDGFFDDLQEITDYADGDGLFLLEKDGEVIGCGIGKPVIKHRPDIDIGMLVAPMHRHHGFGSHIISFLKSHYLGKGLRPICGCSVDNVGSHRALNNAGFVSEHRLLQITY